MDCSVCHVDFQPVRKSQRYCSRHCQHQSWQESHRDRVNALFRAHYSRERLRVLERNRAWRQANPEKWKAIKALYFARRKNARGHCSVEQLLARIAYYGWRCYMCGKPFDVIDHVIPLARGGTNWPSNLRPACKSDNSKKRDRTVVNFNGNLSFA